MVSPASPRVVIALPGSDSRMSIRAEVSLTESSEDSMANLNSPCAENWIFVLDSQLSSIGFSFPTKVWEPLDTPLADLFTDLE